MSGASSPRRRGNDAPVPRVPSTYRPPTLLRDGHSLTVFPTLQRRVESVSYTRRRVELSDGDFIDVDLSSVGANRAVVVSHGLEGDSRRPYVLGMVRAFNRAGWDAAAWNFRGSSGEANRLLRFTHSGATLELAEVVSAVASWGSYRSIVLIGFSLGGNLTLKYLGENAAHLPACVKGGVAFSVPCDLRSSAEKMGQLQNRIYMRRFLADLRQRITSKAAQFPGRISLDGYGSIRTFRDFDRRYTAPLHGFLDEEDYWSRSRSARFVADIRVPTLLVNAQDDPFLSDECFPWAAADSNPHFHLEAPDSGGHVGFVEFGNDGDYWSERRAVAFASLLAHD